MLNDTNYCMRVMYVFQSNKLILQLNYWNLFPVFSWFYKQVQNLNIPIIATPVYVWFHVPRPSG